MLLTFASAPHKHWDQLSFEIKPGKVHTHDSATCSISDTCQHMLTHTHTHTHTPLRTIYTHTIISLISWFFQWKVTPEHIRTGTMEYENYYTYYTWDENHSRFLVWGSCLSAPKHFFGTHTHIATVQALRMPGYAKHAKPGECLIKLWSCPNLYSRCLFLSSALVFMLLNH